MNQIIEAMTPISKIMTRDLHTVSRETPLQKVSEEFKRTRVRHLPVVDNEKLVGIVSQTDMLRLSFGSKFGSEEAEVDEAIFEMLTLDQVMISSVTTVQSHQPVREAARVFLEKEFHALPVTENGNLVGIVTTTDIIRYFLEEG